MSIITKGIDEDCYPDHDWYAGEFDYFVSDAKTRGIEIQEEKSARQPSNGLYVRYEPAISFSGFYSQGDGLAFDANIDWLPFFEAHPSFKTDLPEWYLLLVSNPSYFSCGVRRSGRNSNCMTSQFDEDDASEIVEQGYFAGASLSCDELGLDAPALEEYILDICQDEASAMYKSLEETYEGECEYMKEQRVETLLEEHAELLQPLTQHLKALGEFSRADADAEIDAEELDDEIDFEDLETLSLIEHVNHGVYRRRANECATASQAA